jgi:ABC-type transport system substrate-binding protein
VTIRLSRRLVALVACGLVACTANDRGGDDGPFLRIGVGVGGTATGQGIETLTDLLYIEPLLKVQWDGRAVGSLATEWRWDDGGRTLALEMKPGVLMHDLTPLTIEMVADKLAAMKPAPPEPAALGFEHVTEVTTRAPHTLLLRVSEPDMFLVAALADLRILSPKNDDIGTGPFRIASREPTVEVRRFEQYHGGRSPLAGVRLIPFDTQRSAWAALLRGDVDFVQEVNRDAVEFMKEGSRIETYTSIHPFYIQLGFNLRHRALKNIEVRRAINEGIDRREVIDKAMQGRAQVADTPIWPHHWAYSPPPERFAFDPARAKTRLEAAGFRQAARESAANPRPRFVLRCLVWAEDPQYERIALVVQRQLLEIGIELDIELVSLAQFRDRVQRGDFDTYVMRANGSRTLERMYRMWRSNSPQNPAGPQTTGYTGADAALDRLRRSTDEAEVRSSLAALARRFHEDAPAAFLAWLEVTRAIDARVDIADDEARDPFMNLWRWKIQ